MAYQHNSFLIVVSGGSRGGARGARGPPLFWAKKEEMTEGKKASKIKPGPLLSSKSGSATVMNEIKIPNLADCITFSALLKYTFIETTYTIEGDVRILVINSREINQN